MIKKIALLTALPLLLSACSFIPKYARPAAPVTAAWPTGPAYDKAGAAAGDRKHLMANDGWQDFFQSAELRGLIEKALANNRDLRQSALNIEVERTNYQIQRADLLPLVTANGSLSKVHTPGTLVAGGGGGSTSIISGGGGGGGGGGGHGYTSTDYSADVGISNYELDLFGRLRSLSKAAFETYLASREARDAAQISLIAEVANAYLTLLADRAQLKLSEDTLTAFQGTLDITNARLNNGIGTGLDVAQAQTAVQTAAVNRIAYIRQTAQDLNALTLLVGAPVAADDIHGDMQQADAFNDNLPTGLPSDLLQNRPDIRQAEHALKAQNADIGAARAAFYPQVSLTGTAGLGGRSLSDLFQSGSGSWSFIPSISVPIFTAGANKAVLNAAEIEKNIYVAQYEGTIQIAFREVADALAARGTLGDELAAQQLLADASAQSYKLAQARYNEGIDNYLNVLDSQRDLFTAQQGLLQLKLAMLNNRIVLYRALGGGLSEKAAPVK